MPIVQLDGAQISYRLDGAGPALVLVHGTGGSAEANWGAVTPELARDYLVVRPDYAGSGGTVDDGRPLTLTMLADQVLAAANAAGAASFDLVGFSLGAAVAIYIASEYPHRVRSVVLIAGFVSAGRPKTDPAIRALARPYSLRSARHGAPHVGQRIQSRISDPNGLCVYERHR